ncbi:MAG: VOC family protein [Acidobacteriota bacterium]|nr:VOC family protein [Acidobacteriota bacterium]
MTEAKMQESIEYKPGTFCWVELGTTDGEAAKKFYTQLFEWDFIDNPVGPSGVYTILKQNGKDVGALYQMPSEMTSNGVPPHWMSYISVANADESAAKAKSLGGTLMKEPFDVYTMGRMAVIQDPTGAMFALWQPGTHQGAGIVNTPNSLCWNELATRDTAKAGEFYSGVFGWEKNVQQMGPMTYTSFMNADRPAGGMYEPGPELGEMPPNWMVYFAVADADAIVTRATELGGRSCAPVMNVPGVGRMGVMTDPQGGAFAVIKLENPQV